MSSYNDIVSNDLEEVHMIAGDDKEFTYTVYDENGTVVNLTSASCDVLIFRYGDPSVVFCTLSGSLVAPDRGMFTVNFPSTSSSSLSGVYQQQVRITDFTGKVHVPSQGKIVIFPAPTS